MGLLQIRGISFADTTRGESTAQVGGEGGSSALEFEVEAPEF